MKVNGSNSYSKEQAAKCATKLRSTAIPITPLSDTPGFFKFLKNWMGFLGLVPGISEGGFCDYGPTTLRVPHPHVALRVGSLVVGFLGRLTPTARQVYSDVLAKGTSSAVPLNLIVRRRELLPTGNFRSGQTPIQCR